jgi:hypothetical protein
MKEDNEKKTIFFDLLLIMFIGFKLSGIIDWSWFWVLSPLWITAGIVSTTAVIVVIVHVIKERSSL